MRRNSAANWNGCVYKGMIAFNVAAEGLEVSLSMPMWEFPKIGDPSIVP